MDLLKISLAAFTKNWVNNSVHCLKIYSKEKFIGVLTDNPMDHLQQRSQTNKLSNDPITLELNFFFLL